MSELEAVELVIEDEIARGETQESIAHTYALALRSSWPTDWARVNAAILARWPKGLVRVKRLAWRRVLNARAIAAATEGDDR